VERAVASFLTRKGRAPVTLGVEHRVNGRANQSHTGCHCKKKEENHFNFLSRPFIRQRKKKRASLKARGGTKKRKRGEGRLLYAVVGKPVFFVETLGQTPENDSESQHSKKRKKGEAWPVIRDRMLSVDNRGEGGEDRAKNPSLRRKRKAEVIRITRLIEFVQKRKKRPPG